MIFFILDDARRLGGVEKVQHYLSSELIRNNVNCEIISISNEVKKNKLFLSLPRFIFVFYFIFNLSKKKNVDSIITSTFTHNLCNCMVRFFTSYGCIIQEHCSYHYHSNFKIKIKSLIYKLADHMVCLNEYDKSKYEQLGLKNVIKIFNLIKLDFDDKPEDINDLDFCCHNDYFIIASRFDGNKRIELAIELYLKYKEQQGGKKLLILGDGDGFQYIKAKYQSEFIIFKGKVESIGFYLANADCLLVTSKLECLPTNIIEAKFHSVPTIAFNVKSGIAELINDSVDGFLVDDGDVDQYVNAMKNYDDIKCLEKSKIKARKSYDTNFNSNIIIKYYLELLS